MRFIIIISILTIFFNCNKPIKPVYFYEVKRLGKVQERFKIIKGKDSLNYFYQNYYYDFNLDGEYDDTHDLVLDSIINDTLSYRGKVFFMNKKDGDCWSYPATNFMDENGVFHMSYHYCLKTTLRDTIINGITINNGAIYNNVTADELDDRYEICIDYDKRLFIYMYDSLDGKLLYEEKLMKIENENNQR